MYGHADVDPSLDPDSHIQERAHRCGAQGGLEECSEALLSGTRSHSDHTNGPIKEERRRFVSCMRSCAPVPVLERPWESVASGDGGRICAPTRQHRCLLLLDQKRTLPSTSHIRVCEGDYSGPLRYFSCLSLHPRPLLQRSQ